MIKFQRGNTSPKKWKNQIKVENLTNKFDKANLTSESKLKIKGKCKIPYHQQQQQQQQHKGSKINWHSKKCN